MKDMNVLLAFLAAVGFAQLGFTVKNLCVRQTELEQLLESKTKHLLHQLTAHENIMRGMDEKIKQALDIERDAEIEYHLINGRDNGVWYHGQHCDGRSTPVLG